MADRRMFSLPLVNSDMFLDMPKSAQLLYFHLSMRADDDGFVGTRSASAPRSARRARTIKRLLKNGLYSPLRQASARSGIGRFTTISKRTGIAPRFTKPKRRF
jgi:hypothetical protein